MSTPANHLHWPAYSKAISLPRSITISFITWGTSGMHSDDLGTSLPFSWRFRGRQANPTSRFQNQLSPRRLREANRPDRFYRGPFKTGQVGWLHGVALGRVGFGIV